MLPVSVFQIIFRAIFFDIFSSEKLFPNKRLNRKMRTYLPLTVFFFMMCAT